MSKKKAVAGIGLGALAIAGLSGGTLALWNSSAEVDGHAITSGNLQVALVNSDAKDVSPDRADSPHTIDTSTWRAVPGDVIEISNNLDVALEGDNLVAKLDTVGLDGAIVADGAEEYVTVSTVLKTADGEVIAPDSDGNYLLQAGRDGQDAGVAVDGITVAGATLDGVADVKAVTTITFSVDTPERVLTESELANTDGVTATLVQVRK